MWFGPPQSKILATPMAMPQFCLLFYAILQSLRPKGGGGPWHNAPPPKYAPAYATLLQSVACRAPINAD